MSTQTTDLTAWLDELDAAHKAATSGEWIQSVHADGQPIVAGAFDGEWCTDLAYVPDSPADAAAIVAEHNATPKLTAALRAALALAEEWDVYVAARAERGAPATGSYDDGVNRAQANAAARIRAAVAAAHTEEGQP